MSATVAKRPGIKIGQESARLNVTVVYTSTEGTLRALRKAGALAQSLNARITIVVPQVVSYQLPLNRPPVTEEWNRRHFSVLAKGVPVDTNVRFYLCRDAWQTLGKVLKPHSLIVLGSPKHWWRFIWPTRETRLARRLRRAGHEVIFTETE